MQNQIQHYRVEFFGGPNDGHIEYSKHRPNEEFQLVSKTISLITNEYEITVYKYILDWLNQYQGKYFYADSYKLEAE